MQGTCPTRVGTASVAVTGASPIGQAHRGGLVKVNQGSEIRQGPLEAQARCVVWVTLSPPLGSAPFCGLLR